MANQLIRQQRMTFRGGSYIRFMMQFEFLGQVFRVSTMVKIFVPTNKYAILGAGVGET